MAELVDALDLGSSTARCEGSSPFLRTIKKSPCWTKLVVKDYEFSTQGLFFLYQCGLLNSDVQVKKVFLIIVSLNCLNAVSMYLRRSYHEPKFFALI